MHPGQMRGEPSSGGRGRNTTRLAAGVVRAETLEFGEQMVAVARRHTKISTTPRVASGRSTRHRPRIGGSPGLAGTPGITALQGPPAAPRAYQPEHQQVIQPRHDWDRRRRGLSIFKPGISATGWVTVVPCGLMDERGARPGQVEGVYWPPSPHSGARRISSVARATCGLGRDARGGLKTRAALRSR